MATYKNVHYLPMCLALLIPITLLVTYTLAVCMDHVEPLLPYISETGVLFPESCIFGQMMNLASVLLAFCVYIRHRQVSEYSRAKPENAVPRALNRLASFIGIISCIGLDMVANFESEPVVYHIHMSGALICIISSCVYYSLQTLISYHTVPVLCTKGHVYLRLALSIFMALCTMGFLIFGLISYTHFKGAEYRKWTMKDGGYEWHVLSTVCEWLLPLTQCIFIATFIGEFRAIFFHSPALEFQFKGVALPETGEKSQQSKTDNSSFVQEVLMP